MPLGLSFHLYLALLFQRPSDGWRKAKHVQMIFEKFCYTWSKGSTLPQFLNTPDARDDHLSTCSLITSTGDLSLMHGLAGKRFRWLVVEIWEYLHLQCKPRETREIRATANFTANGNKHPTDRVWIERSVGSGFDALGCVRHPDTGQHLQIPVSGATLSSLTQDHIRPDTVRILVSGDAGQYLGAERSLIHKYST
ncbi:hypothetical protein BKA93DRAFT_747625 [Sparassis latifolia]